MAEKKLRSGIKQLFKSLEIKKIIYASEPILDSYCNGFKGYPYAAGSQNRRSWLALKVTLEKLFFTKNGTGDYAKYDSVVVGTDPVMMVVVAVNKLRQGKSVALVMNATTALSGMKKTSSLLSNPEFLGILFKALYPAKHIKREGLSHFLYLLKMEFSEKSVGFIGSNYDVSLNKSMNFETDYCSFKVLNNNSKPTNIPLIIKALNPEVMGKEYSKSLIPFVFSGLSLISKDVVVVNAVENVINDNFQDPGSLLNYPLTFLDSASTQKEKLENYPFHFYKNLIQYSVARNVE